MQGDQGSIGTRRRDNSAYRRLLSTVVSFRPRRGSVAFTSKMSARCSRPTTTSRGATERPSTCKCTLRSNEHLSPHGAGATRAQQIARLGDKHAPHVRCERRRALRCCHVHRLPHPTRKKGRVDTCSVVCPRLEA